VVRTARALNGDDQLKHVLPYPHPTKRALDSALQLVAYEIAVGGRASLFRRPLRTTPHRHHPSYSCAHTGDANAARTNTDRGRAQRRARLSATDNNHRCQHPTNTRDANRRGQQTAAGGSSYLMRILGNGNVGIGTTSPWAQLSINPNGLTGPAFAVGSSTGTSFVISNGGWVGIGTSTPHATLDIESKPIEPDLVCLSTAW
jgi:hypothetical protein